MISHNGISLLIMDFQNFQYMHFIWVKNVQNLRPKFCKVFQTIIILLKCAQENFSRTIMSKLTLNKILFVCFPHDSKKYFYLELFHVHWVSKSWHKQCESLFWLWVIRTYSKSKFELESNLSKILPVNCKFDSTLT